MVVVVAGMASGPVLASDAKPPLTNIATSQDGSIHQFHALPRRYLTIAKQTVTMGYLLEWRIADAERFGVAAAGSVDQASSRLADVIDSRLRDTLGGMRAETVSESLPALAADVIASSRESAAPLGVEIRRLELQIPATQ